jgi:lauroyl/myristoyl acyltransferase
VIASAQAAAISLKDVYEVPRLAMQGVLAWALPQAVWWPLSRLFGQVNAALHPARTRSDVASIEKLLAGTRHAMRGRAIATEIWCNRYEERFQYLRAWRPGGWNPAIDILGSAHIDEAIASGRGVLFWGSSFSFNDLVTKMAWHRLGLRVVHFSRPAHGFSETRFGIRYLNPVRCRVEDVYLGARMAVEDHETGAALNHLRQHLAGKGLVSFTVGGRGRRTVSARFLAGRLVLATAPLHLAQSAGAAVLPVFTLRGAQGRFQVDIDRPIEMPINSSGEPDYAHAAQDYADRLASYVLCEPGQWKGWRHTSGLDRQ